MSLAELHEPTQKSTNSFAKSNSLGEMYLPSILLEIFFSSDAAEFHHLLPIELTAGINNLPCLLKKPGVLP